MSARGNSRSAVTTAGLMAVLLSSAPVRCMGAAAFNDGFATGKAHHYILNAYELRRDLAFEETPGRAGRYCLRLRNENQTDARTVIQPVTPGRQYEVSFRSKFVNDETLETTPILEETTRPGWKIRYRHLPIFEIVFLDKDKKGLRSTTVAIPYGEWRRHRTAFIALPNAKSVQFVFSSGLNNGTLYLDDMRFEARQDEAGKTVLRFDGDKYDYSGWARPHVDAGMVTRKGKGYFNTGYGSTTEKICVDSEATYRITLKGVHYGPRSWVVVSAYDENGKKLQGDSFVAPCKTEIRITTSAGVRYCDLLIYNCLLEEIVVEKQP